MIANDSSTVRFYNLTSGATFPAWTTPQQRQKLRKNAAYQSRVQVLSEFHMPEASQRIKVTRDQKHLFVSGTYKPMIKCYDVAELSLKFERAVDEEILDFELLTDDYSKLCFLGASNSIFFHAKYGHYYTTRLANPGRSLQYDRATCDLYVAGSTNELIRLNLEAGRFLEPIGTDFEHGINRVVINPIHSLLGLAGSDTWMEFRDPRAPGGAALARLDVGAHLVNAGYLNAEWECGEVTAMEYGSDGLRVGVGTSSGHVLQYDLRSPTPTFIKDHRNEKQIHTIRYAGGQLVSVDPKVMKMWDERTGEPFGALETTVPSNDLVVWPDSGLIFATGEARDTMSYYCPALGKAPKWCAFLDSVAEELDQHRAEHKEEIYENFRFVTIEELSDLNGNALIGTRYLRQYMHGFFMSAKLYQQMRVTVDPSFGSRQSRIDSKVEEMRQNRISIDPRTEPKQKKNKMEEAPVAAKVVPEEEEPDYRFRVMESNPDFAAVEGDDNNDGNGKVRMYEGDQVFGMDEHERKTRKQKKKKKNMTLGELAKEKEERGSRPAQEDRPAKSTMQKEIKFLSKEARDKLTQKKKEKEARVEHNKGRRSARELKKVR